MEFARNNEPMQLVLLFANKTEEDIVLRSEMESMSHRIQLHYILDNPPIGWKGLRGYVTEQVLTSIMPLNDPDTAYLYCGPKPMTDMVRGLFDYKYPQSLFFKF